MQPNILDMYHGDNRDMMIDFSQVAAFGIWGIIHKATQGQKYTDPKFHDRVTAARDAGLLVGAYHYMDATNPITQAEFFAETIGDTLKQGDLIAVDYEKSLDGNHPTLRQLMDFMSHIDMLTHGSVVLYSGALIRETLRPHVGGHIEDIMRGAAEFFMQHRLWLAEYGPHENTPWPWKAGKDDKSAAWLWQYSASGHLPAMIGPADLCYYPHDREQLAREWYVGPSPKSNRGYMG